MKKTQKKTQSFQLSAHPERLIEIANGSFSTNKEAKLFFKAMALTAVNAWLKSDDERTEDDDTILTDTLAALMYVMV